MLWIGFRGWPSMPAQLFDANPSSVSARRLGCAYASPGPSFGVVSEKPGCPSYLLVSSAKMRRLRRAIPSPHRNSSR